MENRLTNSAHPDMQTKVFQLEHANTKTSYVYMLSIFILWTSLRYSR